MNVILNYICFKVNICMHFCIIYMYLCNQIYEYCFISSSSTLGPLQTVSAIQDKQPHSQPIVPDLIEKNENGYFLHVYISIYISFYACATPYTSIFYCISIYTHTSTYTCVYKQIWAYIIDIVYICNI